MSYILDALRRADSERERGAVPGLHTQGLPPLTGEGPVAQRGSAWRWVGAASATLLVAGSAWVLLRPDAPPRATRVAANPAAPVPVLVQASAAALAPAVLPAPPAPLPPVQTPRSEAVAAAPPLPPPITPQIAPPITPPVTPALIPPRPATAAPPPVALEAPRDTATPGPSPTKSVAPARTIPSDVTPAPRVHALHELPDEVRRTIPPLVVNGSVYSKNPADRFLIVNGQIVHELGSVAPDVIVETIGPRAAVLSALGHRFEISY